MKVIKFVGLLLGNLLLAALVVLGEVGKIPLGHGIAGVFLGLLFPYLTNAIQDLHDTRRWKEEQRKLVRAGAIKKDTIIRISFAYLYRIKIGDKYLLVKNERGTEKYQPVGGVYRFSDAEKLDLKRLFNVKDDDKVSIDESSRNDYRLRVENRHLRKFVSRFDKKANRESIKDLSREFREELVDKNIVDWNQISYRYCGRHVEKLEWSRHFQCYELLLADIVELLPTRDQEKDLLKLRDKQSEVYYFATAEEITSLGVNVRNRDLRETIADHSIKILQEFEDRLEKKKGEIELCRVDL